MILKFVLKMSMKTFLILTIFLSWNMSSALIFNGQTLNIDFRLFLPTPVPVGRIARTASDIGSEIGKSVVDMALVSGLLTSANSLLQMSLSDEQSTIFDSNEIVNYVSKFDVNDVSSYLGFGEKCKEKLLCELNQELDHNDDIVSSSVLLGIMSYFPQQKCGLKMSTTCDEQFQESCSFSSSSLLKYILQDLKAELL